MGHRSGGARAGSGGAGRVLPARSAAFDYCLCFVKDIEKGPRSL
jgi:hypothetical protein